MQPSTRWRLRWAALATLLALACLGLGTALQAASGGTAPALVQSIAVHGLSKTSLALTPSSNIVAGNRLIVEVGVWSSSGATAAGVTDSAGNAYTELLHFTASDKTEMSVWTAPITTGSQTPPTITVKPTAKADLGAVALEYAGLSSVSGASVVDRSASASGKTGSAATSVSSGATAPTTAANELALGFYLDSGFGDALSAGAGYTARANISPDGDIELLAEEAVVPEGSTPNASFGTGAATWWLASTVVLKTGEPPTPTLPGAPTQVKATAGNSSATVAWTAPFNGNSGLTSYTVTPYRESTPLSPETVTGTPPLTTATIGGLANGSTYTFKVSATNGIGTGPVSEPSNGVTPAESPEGEWSALMSWPLEAIHVFQLANGNVLAMDGWESPQPTYEWNPTTNTFTSGTAPAAIFCSGLAQLPNGEVMTVGGWGAPTTGQVGLNATAIFNPQTGAWRSVANLHTPRWYPSVTELANGEYVAISGNSTSDSKWADTPETYNPTANTWTALNKVSTSQIHEEEYPFSFLDPNGEVFAIGPSEDVSYLLNVGKESWTSVGSSGVVNGSSVMYRPGKILYTGGASSIVKTTGATAGAATIDLNESSPKWKQTAPMHLARIYHTLTTLADGTVLAIGGETSSDQSIVTTGVLPTEIWNPATETWTTTAPIAAARNYHSTAILMPDGRVLSAGGGHTTGLDGPGQYNAQIYSPAYLSNGPRPTITSAPSASTYNQSITVSTPDASSIRAVNLVSVGADTHQSNMSQHFVPLNFTAGQGSLTVQTPSGAAIAPYGNYMLFILNEKGVPSVSAPLNLSAAPEAPGAPTNLIATASGTTATVTWSVPSQGTSAITSYTVTPYVGETPQQSTVISGTPPAATATISGLKGGVTYTFKVTATNGVGTGPSSSPSNPITISSPTAPGAPTSVSATPGNGTASVSWTAPSANGSTITAYTITPYVGTIAQTPTTITGSPPVTTATVENLVNGTTYTFTVTATNGIGTGPASSASNAVIPTATTAPAFVQQVATHGHGSSMSVTPAAKLTAGNRLIVEVGAWNSSHATTSKVEDSAGDTFTELLHFAASDGTEMSIWSAPITSGGGTRPTITAKPTSAADVGVAALEYSGLSNAAGTAVLDQSTQTSGKTTAAGPVSTSPTPPTTAPNELAMGFYEDSGFGDTLMAKMGFNERVNVSPDGDMEFVAEDAVTGATGSTPASGVQTGAATVWLMATIVFKSAAMTTQAISAPLGAPANVLAFPGSGSATVTWSSARNGGSQITRYRITPYLHRRALPSTYASGNSDVVQGLRNGARYRFRVSAINALGSGPESKLSPGAVPESWLISIGWCSPLLSPYV